MLSIILYTKYLFYILQFRLPLDKCCLIVYDCSNYFIDFVVEQYFNFAEFKIERKFELFFPMTEFEYIPKIITINHT